MGAITIRRLDDAVIAALKAQAKAAGRSMEEEARRIIESATREAAEAVEHKARVEAFLERIRRHRTEVWGGRTLPDDAVDLIREIREEDRTSDDARDP